MKFLREIFNEPTWAEMQEEWERRMAGEKPKGRFCVDCVNYVSEVAASTWSGRCRRTKESMIDGKEYPIDTTAYDQRYHEGPGYCGEGAKFWHEKLVPMMTNVPHFGNTITGTNVKYAEEDDGA